MEPLAQLAETAARLCKADLVTQMVGEFPELQGVMGGHYARAEGLDPRIADAIRDHYKPVGQGDEVPTEPVTVAVAMADKLDSLACFFAIDERPTGSRDPFALRRTALGAISLIEANALHLPLRFALANSRTALIEMWIERETAVRLPDDEDELSPILYRGEGISAIEAVSIVPEGTRPREGITESAKGDSRDAFSSSEISEREIEILRIENFSDVVGDALQFIHDRLEEVQRRQGKRIDLIRAVVPREWSTFDFPSLLMGEPERTRGPGVTKVRTRDWKSHDDLLTIMARVRALQAFVETEDGANLLAGYKRAANILKKEGWDSQEHGKEKSLSYTPPPEENALIAALDSAEPAAAAAIEAEDFAGAMAALASLRAPIDDFFDHVTVNDPDPAKRGARLTLLADFRDAVHRVADFSKIEG